MRDHKESGRRRPSARKAVGIRELKTHAARILRQVREDQTPYVVTHRGSAIGVILPIESGESSTPSHSMDSEMAWDAFVRAGRRLERRFTAGADGVRLLTEMRR